VTIHLFDFQQQASATIVDRATAYLNDPVVTGTKQNPRPVPFFQALSSITASGKTPILADAVASISGFLPIAPIILWLSKGKVVVEQSLSNLMPGGKYNHLLGGAEVKPLADYEADEVADLAKPLVFFATVGTFNQKDKEAGTLVVYRSEVDTADQSTWDALTQRTTKAGIRRPLIVVYDEAQNLSDQQTELLMELEPDAFLVASATMRLPARIAREIDQLRANGWGDDSLVTVVDAKAVADSGLVKSTLALGGYQSPMEETLNRMLSDFAEAEVDARKYRLGGLPKAIYVCNTNVVAGNAAQQDDPKQPFEQRQAPPILIWRHLVYVHGIDPSEIALYCSLKMDRDFPPPDGFTLFKGGDKDYAAFTAGNFRHVIFNLSLQEGWDDPLCYFAYIDKSMDSRVQIEQIIGRVLRQPDAKAYPAERLNTAHFYVRVDQNKVFDEILNAVGAKLRANAPEIRIVATAPGKTPPQEYQPKQARTIPGTALETSDAVQPVGQLISQLTNYQNVDDEETRGSGSRTLVLRKVGDDEGTQAQWEMFEQSNRVLARWIFQREVRKRHLGALGVAPTSGAQFDARVGLGSRAEAHIVQVAERVVETYIESVQIMQKSRDAYEVGPLLARPEDVRPFKNALHDGYDRLNPFEVDFAEALDRVGVPWCRNPSRTGYGIPLPSLGPTSNFYPDFIAWANDDVFAIDTKGGHILAEAVARKLLWIEAPKKGETQLFVKLVSEGKWNADAEQVTDEGYSAWGMKAGGGRVVRHFPDLDSLVSTVLTSRRG
jgi:type III restriction enzyme